MPFAILASWESITKRVGEYMIAFLVLETLMIACSARWIWSVLSVLRRRPHSDVFIIGIWAEARVYASFKFFLYTLVVRC